MPTELSATEVSALLDVDEKNARKEIELGVLEQRAKPIRFTFPEAVYLSTVSTLGVRLSAIEDRRTLLHAIQRGLASRRSHVDLSPTLVLNLGRVADEVGARVARFTKWKSKRVVENPKILAGEPTFKGSRLSVRKVGDMLLREDVSLEAEIREDYPYLTADDIEFAPRFARAYPRRGRPREAAA